MTRREIREEIFKFLFEYELVKNDVDTRLEEIIQEEKIRKEEHKDRYQWRRGNRKLPYRAGSPRSLGNSETYSKAGRSLHVRKPRNS